MTTADTNAIAELTAKIQGTANAQSKADLLVSRGKLLWSLQRRREAINDYTEAAALYPAGPAPALLEHSMEILNFFNPDLYNP
ncbi:MAG: hypothetical protein NC187_04500 [Candidatus Amulumruptor caecigallinarius]|nr:hypothetical protein [Candidatus Amulumruptor caecigallinarius]MCM1396732.1 hypothetical protein [Candidatus Amulumruptor caecigallinarius]MCM1453210.1 hypothetical protein [bacterium]